MVVVNILDHADSAVEIARQHGYRLIECLHKGGHFATHRGVRVADDFPVIVKTALGGSSVRAEAKMEREFELTRRLNDPGVVCAEALEGSPGGQLLVFPDSSMVSLSRFLEGRVLGLDSFFSIALQLAEILGRIHMHDVVHKDVKPANIVINPHTLSLQLTDFGIAAALARETASNHSETELEGTLAYIAPEQTGRMNRSIDGRSDLYSLGITFYELLTHRLPFNTSEPVELVHNHIARVPVAPHLIEPEVPQPLSDIVMKLMAKDPEDRYQSAFGLAHDLADLQRRFQEKVSVKSFVIGQRDVSSRLLLPERLYGRDQPLQALIAAVDRGVSGRSNLIQIGGGAGIGKSALVREVMRSVANRQGHFISGKFDQLKRNAPYLAINSAFEALVERLLTEDQRRVEHWRQEILDSVGTNAQVILDVIPAFEQLLGPQPEVAKLGPAESQIRFNLVFRRFVRMLATAEHPLVIFLDDTQWADDASLALIDVLLSDTEINHLALVCAFRDNEIHAGHSWVTLVDKLQQQHVPVVSIILAPLESEFVSELVAGALRTHPDEVHSLAALITEKTGGNPFFVRQFLKTLHERGLLKFDPDSARWQWDVNKINQEQITDNVVELIMARIDKLDADARRLTQLAACIGNRIDLKTLSVVYGDMPARIALGLRPVLQQEIMAPIGEAYKFVRLVGSSELDQSPVAYRFPHDRLQQAAYLTIPLHERPDLHQRIGHLILAESNESQVEERLFEIVNHLNLAIELIETRVQTLELAALNLRAGCKAKDSMAYEAALEYLETGAELLGENSWNASPQLSYELCLQRAEANYLLGRFDEAGRLADLLFNRSENTLHKVEALDLQVLKHTTALEYGEAIDAALRALELLGEKIPRSPSQAQLLSELAKTRLSIGSRTTADLKALPRMKNQSKLAAMRVLMLATPPAYFDDPNLMPYLALRMVRLSVQHGNAAHSAYGYIAYGLVLCGVLNKMPEGLAYGKMSLELVEQVDAQDIRGKVMMVYGGFIMHWNGRLNDSLPMYLQGAAASLEVGDLEFHGYNRYAHASYSFFSGTPLDKVAQLLVGHNAAVRIHKHEKTDRIMRMVQQAVRDLRGRSAEPVPVDEPEFDEKANLELWAIRDRQALAYFYKYRIITQFMSHDYQGCLESARVINQTIHAVMGMVYVVWYRTFESLALSALAAEMPPMQRQSALVKIRLNISRLARWSRYAPENYLHKFYMVKAEYARVRGQTLTAVECYEKAIGLAQKNGAIHDLAIAHELAGEFYLSNNQTTAARAHLSEARNMFQRWGAMAWVEHMEERHQGIFSHQQSGTASPGSLTVTDSSQGGDFIDVETITNAARAISEKMLPEDVLHEVMNATVVNAGATRGVLLLVKPQGLHIEAEAGSDAGETVVRSILFETSGKAPASIVNYVLTSRKSVVLDEAPQHPTFSADPYINKNTPLSVMCLPIVDKGHVSGLLYLENKLVRGAFTPSRIRTLEVLAAQASISLENARLYGQISEHAISLERKVGERTRELEDAYTALREIFGKYVPKRVAETVVASKGLLKPTQTVATMLYSDIAGFTGIVEGMAPEQVMKMLNEYFPAVIEPIERNGGIVNQFQGDAMLVTFNVPIADARHAEKAVKTAMEIQQTLRNRTFAGMALRTRIGINTGPIIAGNIGSGDRFNYTVHGDAVNLSARIEQLNKEYNTSVLISGTTANLLRNKYELIHVGQVGIRGKTEPVRLFALPEV